MWLEDDLRYTLIGTPFVNFLVQFAIGTVQAVTIRTKPPLATPWYHWPLKGSRFA